MKIKPVIMILTSNDVSEQISKLLKSTIEKRGEQYAVVLDEKNYAKGRSVSASDYWRGIKIAIMRKRVKIGRANEDGEKKIRMTGSRLRIKHAIMRFNPDCIVCLSAYTHCLALDVKKHAGLDIPVIALVPTFTFDKNFFDVSTDTFIVENPDAKAEIVRLGLPARDVAVLGVPISIKSVSDEERLKLKSEFGLGKTPTVFLNCRDKHDCAAVFDMLLDQGDLVNVVAYCPRSEVFNELRRLVEIKAADNVQLFDKKAKFDDYLLASDFVVTYYNIPTIYKAFLSGKSVVAYPPKGEEAKRDVEYLAKNRLVYAAKDLNDVINGLYKLLQTDFTKELNANVAERMPENGAGQIAEFISEFAKKANANKTDETN